MQADRETDRHTLITLPRSSRPPLLYYFYYYYYYYYYYPLSHVPSYRGEVVIIIIIIIITVDSHVITAKRCEFHKPSRFTSMDLHSLETDGLTTRAVLSGAKAHGPQL